MRGYQLLASFTTFSEDTHTIALSKPQHHVKCRTTFLSLFPPGSAMRYVRPVITSYPYGYWRQERRICPVLSMRKELQEGNNNWSTWAWRHGSSQNQFFVKVSLKKNPKYNFLQISCKWCLVVCDDTLVMPAPWEVEANLCSTRLYVTKACSNKEINGRFW